MKRNKGLGLIGFMFLLAVFSLLMAGLSSKPAWRAVTSKETTAEAIEAAIVATNDCDVGIDNYVTPTEIAKFLKKHGSKFAVTPIGQGVLIHRKSCDE